MTCRLCAGRGCFFCTPHPVHPILAQYLAELDRARLRERRLRLVRNALVIGLVSVLLWSLAIGIVGIIHAAVTR